MQWKETFHKGLVRVLKSQSESERLSGIYQPLVKISAYLLASSKFRVISQITVVEVFT